jgi:hypothetical protein
VWYFLCLKTLHFSNVIHLTMLPFRFFRCAGIFPRGLNFVWH